MSHLLGILCVFGMTAYIKVGEFFFCERNNLEINAFTTVKCILL